MLSKTSVKFLLHFGVLSMGDIILLGRQKFLTKGNEVIK